ncbi:MAG TPA: hypothetical protein VF006_12135 [Longimicrobium sp.]
MSRSVELSDEVYEILEQTAAAGGITPAQWIARYLAAFGDEAEPDPDTGAPRTAPDVLAAHVGRGMFSERRSEIVADDPAEKDGAAPSEAAGAGTATPRNMAERLAGRLGTLSGSGGRPSFDDVPQSFTAPLEAEQGAGTS